MAIARGGRALFGLLLTTALTAGLWYLRDPAWLRGMTSGVGRWETAPDGTRFRWMGGHASLFVPSDARAVEIPLRTIFDTAADWPVAVSITLDDRPVERLVLADGGWRTAEVRLPPAAGRRVRRLDIRVDRMRADDRGAALGEIRLR